MLIGCPKEIKPQEFRVGLTPSAALQAIGNGHQVIVETGAGAGAGFRTRNTPTPGPGWLTPLPRSLRPPR